MATFTELLPERKSSKRSVCKFATSADEYGPTAGLLTIETDRAGCVYRVEEFPTGWDGRGFRLVKVAGGTDGAADNYACFVARNGQDRQCECRGFLRWGGSCKHLDALMACIGNGWL